MDVINEYEQVLIGNLPKIPPRLFQNEPSANEHLALSVFRYAIEKLLRWTPMEAYRLFSPAVIETMKLTQLLNYINFPTELTKDNTEYIVSDEQGSPLRSRVSSHPRSDRLKTVFHNGSC